MSTLVPDEISMEDPLCDSSFGSMVTLDYVNPLTKWKKSMAGGGGNKKRYQYCIDSLGTIVYLRVLQGHSGCNLIDPTLQDNILEAGLYFNPGVLHTRDDCISSLISS